MIACFSSCAARHHKAFSLLTLISLRSCNPCSMHQSQLRQPEREIGSKVGTYIQNIRDIFMEELFLELIGHIDADKVEILQERPGFS